MRDSSAVILVVDDERDTLRLIRINLEAQGYRVITAETGHEALRVFEQNRIDLVLLDIMLPGLDGLEVCHRLRDSSQQLGIIMLSALALERDKVVALEMGADDYIVKPFEVDELLARVRAVLRRTRRATIAFDRRVAFDGCEFDPSYCHLSFESGEEEALTRTECALLSVLIENAGRVVTHRSLLTAVWGAEYIDDYQYLWTYIRRLRRKLKDDSEEPRLLFTEPGVGYRFTEDVTFAS